MTDYRQTLLRAARGVDGAFTAPDDEKTTLISLSTTAAAATGLEKDAVYRLWSDVDCFVLFTDGGTTAADAQDMPLTAKMPEWLRFEHIDRVSAIVATGTGTLYLTRMG